MFWRVFSFFLCQALPAVLALLWVGADYRPWALFAACVLGSCFWFAWDSVRAVQVLLWLRSGDTSATIASTGFWGEIFNRSRKLLRVQERKIEESDLRLQDFLAAMQASPNGVVLLDDGGRIEWLNQIAASHFGLDAKRDELQHFSNLVRDPVFAAYYAGPDFHSDVVMFGRTHSSAKPVKISVHMHPYGAGRSLLLSRDITTLEQAEAIRRDFVANVSHEIRTPLTVLSGFVETLQTLTLDEKDQKHYLALMAAQASNMRSLVDDLLTLSKLEGSAPPPHYEWIAVNALMAQCMDAAHGLSRVFGMLSQNLHFDIAPGFEIAGASKELYSAFFNLIGNAIRYTPAQRPIAVSWVVQADGVAVFSVKDQGIGIAPEHLPRLTERFYRVDRSRSRDTGGTGLGLAIVKHICQRHDAELLIESHLGNGSKFSIQFPPSRIRPIAQPEGASLEPIFA